MIHPFKYEGQDTVNLSTGHKAKPADLMGARGIGMWTTPVAAREQAVRKYPHKTGHICIRVFLFRKLAFSLVNSFAVSELGAIPCWTDRIIFQKV